MSTYVLIHGAWHGAWCWYRIIPQLEKAGHRVLALDLPSLGRDKTPPGEIGPDTWADYVCGVLENESEPVILVGHSRAGVIISQVAERCPEKVGYLVYLSAFLLPNGQCLRDAADDPVNSGTTISTAMVVDPEQGCSTLPDEVLVEGFYHRCPDEDVALARTLLQPEPLAPLLAPLTVTEGRFGRVPRAYIHCLQDRAVTLPLQQQFVAATPCDKVYQIDTDHSPFFSTPYVLAGFLLSLEDEV